MACFFIAHALLLVQPAMDPLPASGVSPQEAGRAESGADRRVAFELEASNWLAPLSPGQLEGFIAEGALSGLSVSRVHGWHASAPDVAEVWGAFAQSSGGSGVLVELAGEPTFTAFLDVEGEAPDVWRVPLPMHGSFSAVGSTLAGRFLAGDSQGRLVGVNGLGTTSDLHVLERQDDGEFLPNSSLVSDRGWGGLELLSDPFAGLSQVPILHAHTFGRAAGGELVTGGLERLGRLPRAFLPVHARGAGGQGSVVALGLSMDRGAAQESFEVRVASGGDAFLGATVVQSSGVGVVVRQGALPMTMKTVPWPPAAAELLRASRGDGVAAFDVLLLERASGEPVQALLALGVGSDAGGGDLCLWRVQLEDGATLASAVHHFDDFVPFPDLSGAFRGPAAGDETALVVRIDRAHLGEGGPAGIGQEVALFDLETLALRGGIGSALFSEGFAGNGIWAAASASFERTPTRGIAWLPLTGLGFSANSLALRGLGFRAVVFEFELEVATGE